MGRHIGQWEKGVQFVIFVTLSGILAALPAGQKAWCRLSADWQVRQTARLLPA
jgi:hypothetical protein